MKTALRYFSVMIVLAFLFAPQKGLAQTREITVSERVAPHLRYGRSNPDLDKKEINGDRRLHGQRIDDLSRELAPDAEDPLEWRRREQRQGIPLQDMNAKSIARSVSKPQLAPVPLISDFQVNEENGPGFSQYEPSIARAYDGSYVAVWSDYRNGASDIFMQRFSNLGVPQGSSVKVNDDSGSDRYHFLPRVAMDSIGNFVVVWYDERNGGDIYAQRYASNGSLLGTNFIVNDDAGSAWQYWPSVAMNGSGNFVVAWYDYRNGNSDIYVQRYASNGSLLGTNFKVNDDAGSSSQDVPSIAMDGSGNFVVAWYDSRNGNSDIYAQRYAPNGSLLGTNFKVNDDAGSSSQYQPSVAMDGSGNFVVTWYDYRNGNSDIYAQRYASNGSLLGTNFKVNDDAGSSSQDVPSIAMDGSGNFVVAWYDSRNGGDIYAQRYASNGSLLGTNFKVNDDAGSAWQYWPSVAMDGSGNFVVAWEDYRSGNGDIYAQRYASGGTLIGVNTKLNDEPNGADQLASSIAVDASGNFVVAWYDYRNGNYDIYGQRYASNGSLLGTNFKVNDDAGSSTQYRPSIAMDGSGNFVVAWYDYRNGNADIYAQRYASNGSLLGTNFKVNDDGGSAEQYVPSVAIDGSGNFVVAWYDYRNGNSDIYAQRYASNGSLLGTNFKVNDDAGSSYQYRSSIAMDGSGNFIVAWYDERNGNGDIYAQRYASNGSLLGTNFKVNDDAGSAWQHLPSIAMDGSGNFVVSWYDERNGNGDIYAQRYASNGSLTGTNFKVNDDAVGAWQYWPSVAVDGSGNFVVAWNDYRNGSEDIYAQRYFSNGTTYESNYKVTDEATPSLQFEPRVKLAANRIYTTWRDNRTPNHGFDVWANITQFAPNTPPNIVVSPDSLVFGTSFVGASKTDTLFVQNTGTTSLTVTGISSNNTVFGVTPTSFSVAGFGQQLVLVTFTPPDTLPASGTLTIASNDSDQAVLNVPVSGHGVYPPVITVTPDSFMITLAEGDSTTQTMTIGNTGQGVLNWNTVNQLSASSFAYQTYIKRLNEYSSISEKKGQNTFIKGPAINFSSGGPDSAGYRWIDSDHPGGPVFNWVDIKGVGVQVNMTGDDGNTGPFPVGFSFPFYHNNFNQFRICTNGWISFTSSSGAYSNRTLPNIDAPENLIAAFWDDLEFISNKAYYYYDGSKLTVQFDDVRWLGNNSTSYTFQILLFPNGNIKFQYLNMVGDVTGSTVGIQNQDKTVGLTVAFNTAYIHNNLSILISKTPFSLLTLIPASGTVAPGVTQDVSVKFNAKDLSGGDYRSVISITSNDPINSPKNVPANLHVTGRPVITVIPDSINSGVVFIGMNKVDTVKVRNIGSEPLVVSGITSNLSVYTPNVTSFTVPADGMQPVIVTFSPTDSVNYSGVLAITSNDTARGVVNVVLMGRGVYPPVITVSPDSFVVTLAEGDSTTHTMTIGNTGQGMLNWISNLNLTPPNLISIPAIVHGESDLIHRSIPSTSTNNLNFPVNIDRKLSSFTAGSTIIAVSNSNYPSETNGLTATLTELGFNFVIVNSVAQADSIGASVIIIRFGSASPYFNYTLTELDNWVQSGKGLIQIGDWINYFANNWVALHVFGESITVEVNNSSHPIMQGLPASWQTNGYWSGGFISGATAATLPDLISNSTYGKSRIVTAASIGSGRGVFIGFNVYGSLAGPNDKMLFGNAIRWASNRTGGWLTLNPTSGTIAPGSVQDAEVKFNAARLYTGEYNANLSITSNDPVNSPKNIPVHLTVTPGNRPAIVVTQDSLHAMVTGDASETMSFYIKNVGTQTLDFSISDTLLALVRKQYANNDGVHSTTSKGASLNLPIKKIQIQKSSSKSDAVSVKQKNAALSQLRKVEYQAQRLESNEVAKQPHLSAQRAELSTNVSWLNETPTGGSVVPGDSVRIDVTFDGTGLAAGEYRATIKISSNDPFKNRINVPATLTKLLANFTTDDNENNALAGVPDFDMDTYLYNTDPNTPIEFNIFVEADSIHSVQLNMLTWDVDWADVPGTYIGERDSVVFNGHFAGYLTGANGEWSTSVFYIDPLWVVPGPNGKNLVQIFIDKLNEGWAVTVDWGQLIINGATGLAHVRYVNTNKATYTPGDTLWTFEEIDTDSLPMSVRIETDIVDPSNNVILGTNRTFTAGPGDEPFSEVFILPTTLASGTYKVMVIVYDAVTNLQQDIRFAEFSVQLPAPVNVFAGNAFDGIVPLTWDLESDPSVSPKFNFQDGANSLTQLFGSMSKEQSNPLSIRKGKGVKEFKNDKEVHSIRSNIVQAASSLTVQHFNVYKSTTSGGPYSFVAPVSIIGRIYYDDGDFIDTDVTNSQTYYYVVTTVYDVGESGYSSEVSATPQAGGHTLQSVFASVQPTLDGVMNAGEWDDATVIDIQVPGSPQPVWAKIKNTSNMLYLGIEDIHNATGNDFNQIGIYFDADYNRTWDPDTSTREGNLWVSYQNDSTWIGFRGWYGNYPNVGVTGVIQNPIGIQAKASLVSGHLQYEIAINMESEYFDSVRDTLGLFLFNYDDSTQIHFYGGTRGFNGFWPFGNIWTAPQTYGSIVLSKEQTVGFPLNTGWNLISWNVHPQNDSTNVLLTPILDNLIVALGFENGGLTFDPTIPAEFNTLKSMDYVHGYWLKMSKDTILNIVGPPIAPQTPIFLEAGYNLASYLPQRPDSTNHAINSVLDNTTVVLGFDGGGLTFDPAIPPEFNTLHLLRPGFGYWIKTKGLDTLVYPSTPTMVAKPMLTAKPKSTEQQSDVIATNEWISMWGNNVKLDGALLPVGTVIKAVNSKGTVCGEYVVQHEGKFGLMPVYRDDPKTEVDEGARQNEGVTLFIGKVKVPFEVKWTHFGDVVNFTQMLTSVGGELRSLPKTFALHQNYPNPFNPSTTIRYELPKNARVVVKVFNILGEEVATLVDEEQNAGYYNVVWDGRSSAGTTVSSGAYFYHLSAGDYGKTLKMVLVK